MRLFTGFALPGGATAALVAIRERLRPLADLRWIPPEKLHITLTFIGEWPEGRVPEVKAALREVMAAMPVNIGLRGLGWMPNPRFPRSLYAGVQAGPELNAAAAASARALGRLGVPLEDRTYRPHVTLARVRGRVRVDGVPLHADPIASFQADSFCLYLSSEGKYTKLEEFRL